MTRRIIQFGTSRFLQAHVDLFVHQARLAGEPIGPITVVKTTSGDARGGRIPALKCGLPFPVRIRGVEAGRVIDETIAVGSVDQAFDAQDEWPAVVRCFADEAEIAVSNVGERGYERPVEDVGQDVSRSPPGSFPAKLLVLLLARFQAGGRPLLFLPTELVSGNGRRLAAIVADLAAASRQPDAFRAWLSQSVVFADTLVDRIVSEAIEPVGAVAEPYALWAIQRGNFTGPFRHPAVRLVDDLEPVERLKIHILNLGHTVLADQWRRQGRAADESVRAILHEPAMAQHLATLYADEVVPGFALRGMGAEAQRYVATTVERFRNPFLDHRLSDIAQNHDAKLKSRVANFIEWARGRDPGFTAPRLSKLLSP
jgi:tagaturonate reductase